MEFGTVEQWIGSENKLGIDSWYRKYQHQGETFKDWLERVSGGNPAARRLILEKKWLPGGRILANRGIQHYGKKVTYSNCYVIPGPSDNIESIFDAAKYLAKTYSYGGGCGTDVSKLSPAGARVNNTAEETTGSVSFMPLYDLTTELIGQHGRRGALMLSIDCDHPDIEDFLKMKENLGAINNANLSVKFSKEFLFAASNDQEIKLSFTRPETGETVEHIVKAKEILMKFAEMNWDNAEPGALFWDTIKHNCIVSEDADFEFAGVNPCAEQPLPAFGSCLLSSFNLAAYVITEETNTPYFNFGEFVTDVGIVVAEMNTLLDEGMVLHPLKEQQNCARNWRQVGIGVMGVADMLIKMKIKYGSADAIKLCDVIGQELANAALYNSALLAEEFGVYPNYKHDAIINSPYVKYNADGRTMKKILQYGLRNSQLLTIAPTGTISNVLGISGGMEPIYAISYDRLTKSIDEGGDKTYKMYTPIVAQYMRDNGITDEKYLPDYFVTSHNLEYKKRIDMQAAWQKHIDASISSTINLPKETTIEEVYSLYKYAWQSNLKGVTIFREGCKRVGILTSGLTEKACEELRRGDWKPLADDTVYYPKKIYTGCGKIKLMIGYSASENMLQDLYVVRSGKGGCERNIQASVIAMSGMLRLGGNLFNLEKAFEGMATCASFSGAKARGEKISLGGSCGSAMLKTIKEFMASMGLEDTCVRTPKPVLVVQEVEGVFCPECGTELRNQEGCVNCPTCGFTKCSA